MSDYNKQIGKRIFDTRKEKGLTRTQLKDYAGISEVYLGMIERGERGTSIAHMVRIAEALNMSMDYMILGKEKEYDKADAAVRSLDSLGPDECKLIEKICRAIKINNRTSDPLKTAQELVSLFVQYEKGK